MNNMVRAAASPIQNPTSFDVASQEIVGLRSEFEKMLGDAVGVERFERAVLTAIQRDPALLSLPRDTLISAGLKAAQDRLLPDGREGTFLVRWNSKTRRKEVTWAPMIYGIVKIAKQYAGVRSLSCEVVYDGEPFRILLGDEMRIDHERIPGKVRNGAEIGCYAIATYADGAREREFMTAEQIAQVEAQSESAKAGVGPWKTWRGEMMRKSVIRRLSKKLPALDEGGERLRQVIERVDEDYDFGRPALEAVPQAPATEHHKTDVDRKPWDGMAWPICDRSGKCRDFYNADDWTAEIQSRIESIQTHQVLDGVRKRKMLVDVWYANKPVFAELMERGDAASAPVAEVELLFTKATALPKPEDDDVFPGDLPLKQLQTA